MDQEELDYREFLSTLWSDPPIDATTGASLHEEEEEEEDYQQAEDEEEDDYDEEGDDDEDGEDDKLAPVRHTEVRDLVSDCLKTVVSNGTHRALNPSFSSSSSSSAALDSSPASTHQHANLTNYVKSIFNKSKNGITSEICIEGMPVNTIRSIIARQMSMCIQLLLQLLLLTSNNSSSSSLY